MKKAWFLSYPLSAQWRLWSDWADAQADLSLRWAHNHFVGFVMRRLKLLRIILVLLIIDWSKAWHTIVLGILWNLSWFMTICPLSVLSHMLLEFTVNIGRMGFTVILAESAVNILNIGTCRSEQTVQTQIRQLLKEPSDQGLHCLPFCHNLLGPFNA